MSAAPKKPKALSVGQQVSMVVLAVVTFILLLFFMGICDS